MARRWPAGLTLDGRIDSLTLGPSTATYADLSQVFGYDSLNRLTSANLAAGQTQSFTYDSNSNRTNATINAASTTYTYPSTSHKLSSLSGATTRSFTYDNAGNVTVSAGITYVYDGRGRMKSAGATTYLVNGLGQRVKKSTASVDTFFAYDEAGHLIGEYDTSGTPIQETVWLGDTPVAIVKPKTGGFDVFYIWSDNLGTPRQITDTSNVSRWEWANNDPFGNNTPNENPASIGVFSYNLRFPGQYYDLETGKHYNYFRDYDPAIGRYIESDPLGLDAELNTYVYVRDNPLGLTDAFGLAACCNFNLPSGPIGDVALTCFAESTPRCKEGWYEKILIVDTIFNRAAGNRSYWGGSDVGSVIRQPGQYDAYNREKWNRGKNPNGLDPAECAELRDCISAAQSGLHNTFTDYNGFNQTKRRGRLKVCRHYFRKE
jgi:RHS repeat-associated protein